MARFLGLGAGALLASVAALAPPDSTSGAASGAPAPAFAEKIRAALRQLDPSSDKDWTEAGKPDMERLQQLTGERGLTRRMIDAVAPGINRVNFQSAPSDLSTIGNGGGDAAPSLDSGVDSAAALAATDAQLRSMEPGGGEAAGAQLIDPGTGERRSELSVTSGNDTAPAAAVGVDRIAVAEERGSALAPGSTTDATLNHEERQATDGPGGRLDDPDYVGTVGAADPSEIAERYADPILLLEAAALAGQGARYVRNTELQNVIRAYQASQRGIREVQGRIDYRADRRALDAKEASAAEARQQEQFARDKRERDRLAGAHGLDKPPY